MSRAMASGARAVGADPLVDTIAHKGSEGAAPPGRDAEERGRVIGVERRDGVAKPRDEPPETDAKAQRNENRGHIVRDDGHERGRVVRCLARSVQRGDDHGHTEGARGARQDEDDGSHGRPLRCLPCAACAEDRERSLCGARWVVYRTLVLIRLQGRRGAAGRGGGNRKPTTDVEKPVEQVVARLSVVSCRSAIG